MGYCEKENFVIGAQVVHYFFYVCVQIGKAILAIALLWKSTYTRHKGLIMYTCTLW
jgi:hypothetical protein